MRTAGARWTILLYAPRSKGKHRLHILTFQEQAVIQTARQQAGQVERALNRHIVYLCREDFG
jgi:hypothetical protein